jgi:HEAT repeat protein
MNQPFYSSRKFKEQKTEPELLKLLDDPAPLTRQAAIDSLVGLGNKAIVPRLLEKAESDPFIVVRHAAFNGLKTLTGEQIEAPQIERWKLWWEKHKEAWPPKN